jgi:GTP diphosphokinase / guanosine-3',5'-bis(diphosphate) 3'-diphosphatase
VSGREKHPYSIWRKMQERHVSFENVTDIIAFRIITPTDDDCYKALGLIHRKWKMVPGRFKDYISTPKRNGYRSLHTTIMHQLNMRIEIQIRSQSMHQQSEFGLAAHWAYKQKGGAPDGQAGWIRDLLEILDQTHDPEELLENTRIAMYQDRIFAFTPKGALHQLPKGATPVDFAYAVHTKLGDRTVGAKVNGRLVPLRTQLSNGDTVEILVSDKQTPQPNWMGYTVTAKARSAVRRHVRGQERVQLVALGRKLYDELVARLPGKIGDKARGEAVKRLKLEDENALFVAIARQRLRDNDVLEALVPGVTSDKKLKPGRLKQGSAVSIAGLTPGVAYKLAECCHPVPGDRIIGLTRENVGIEVHTIDCGELANGVDADWIDLRWQEDSEGGSARLCVVVPNEPGTLAEMAGILGANEANIMNLRITAREGDFHTFEVLVEVRDVHHLMRILSALRASDTVVQAERV